MYHLDRIYNFRVIHEVSCQPTCPEFEHLHEFQVTLEFESEALVDGFTLVTEATLSNFEEFLKVAKNLPDVWSVEMLAEQLYNEAIKFSYNLKRVSIFSTDESHKIGRFTGQAKFQPIESSLELDVFE